MTRRTSPPDPSGPVLVLGAEWFDDRPGGMNRYVRDLLGALSDRRGGLRAVMLGPAVHAPEFVVTASHAAAPLPVRMMAFARAAVRSGRDADVVDAHFALYALLPVRFGRLRRKPLVVHFHGPWADESQVSTPAARQRAAAKRALERHVYRRADQFVVLSDAFRRLLVERYRVAPWAVNVVPPTVDLDGFTPGDKVEARRSLGLPTSGFLAVVARRLEPRMGLEVLLDSWAEVSAAIPEATLAVIGAGQLRAPLEDRARSAGVANSVRFLGRVSDDDLVQAYRAADSSVVPTVALEGFGLVVLESLACGTPVVVTDVGGLPETVHGLEGAAVVSAGDAAALAQALLAMAGGAGPSSEACRTHAETFSPRAMAERHETVYQRARTGAAGRRTRVLFVDHCAQRSGGELAMARLLSCLDVYAHVVLGEPGPLVELLERQGTNCEVLQLGRAAQAVRKDGVRAARFPVAGAISTIRAIMALRRRIAELRPDVVHTNSLKAALYGGVAGRLAGVPVVWHVRDRIASDYLPPLAVRLVRAAARHLPSAVIANSAATMATLGDPGCPTFVVPSPVRPLAATTPADRSGAPFVVGMVGRLAPWKGQDVFIRAFRQAFPDGDARAVVVGGALFGEGDYEVSLRELTDAQGLGQRVRFTGQLDDVASEVRHFDVLVHASVVPEPFGQVVVEGMAAGVPVVAAAAGGPAETITDGVDGLLYPPGDVEALAALLRMLAADPARRAKLGSNGYRRSADFAPAVVAEAVEAVYDVLVDRPVDAHRSG